MATKPSTLPKVWASLLNYDNGPFIGSPMKVVPPDAIAASGHRPGSLFPTPAEYENYQQNQLCSWVVDWVYLGASTGAADAHIVETDASGFTQVQKLSAINTGAGGAIIATAGNATGITATTTGASNPVFRGINTAGGDIISGALGGSTGSFLQCDLSGSSFGLELTASGTSKPIDILSTSSSSPINISSSVSVPGGIVRITSSSIGANGFVVQQTGGGNTSRGVVVDTTDGVGINVQTTNGNGIQSSTFNGTAITATNVLTGDAIVASATSGRAVVGSSSSGIGGSFTSATNTALKIQGNVNPFPNNGEMQFVGQQNRFSDTTVGQLQFNINEDAFIYSSIMAFKKAMWASNGGYCYGQFSNASFVGPTAGAGVWLSLGTITFSENPKISGPSVLQAVFDVRLVGTGVETLNVRILKNGVAQTTYSGAGTASLSGFTHNYGSSFWEKQIVIQNTYTIAPGDDWEIQIAQNGATAFFARRRHFFFQGQT